MIVFSGCFTVSLKPSLYLFLSQGLQLAVFCRPRGVPPMTAFSKNAEHLEICPPPGTQNLPPPHAGPRPDSRPQAARFSVSRAVSPPASQLPGRHESPHSGPLSSKPQGCKFRFSAPVVGCKFARNTGKNYRVNSGTVHQNAQVFTSQQASQYRPATVRARVGFGSSSGDPKPLGMMGFSE